MPEVSKWDSDHKFEKRDIMVVVEGWREIRDGHGNNCVTIDPLFSPVYF